MVKFKEEYTEAETNAINDDFNKDGHYLDNAGTTLYSLQQIKDIFENFSQNQYCNPHTSKNTEDLVDQVRYKILKNFNTNPDEYSVVFTSGATASLKLVAECFLFHAKSKDVEKGQFRYLQDSHTSVLGMREIVNTTDISVITREQLLGLQKIKVTNGHSGCFKTNSLIAFPAQCNFNGYKYPLNLIDAIHNNSLNKSTNWYVCLDAASYVSTSYLDLQQFKPDFVCLSFYKMFGYPTGLGALLVRKSSEQVLQKKYYGGGTVKIALSTLNWHRKRDRLYEKFEDGTISFLSIIALLQGYKTLERLVPSSDNKCLTMMRISRHCFNLAKYFYDSTKNLAHSNKQLLFRFYHDTSFDCYTKQGGIINFNVVKCDGTFVGFAEIAAIATIYNIHLRTGCFCNPGACQRQLKLTNNVLYQHFKAGHECGDLNDLINGIPTGSVRISVGYMTEKEDIDAVINMIVTCYLKQQLPPDWVSPSSEIHESNQSDVGLAKTIKLKEICLFPIKSCGAFKIRTKWPLTMRGLKYDREWMIVNSNYVCLTQKSCPPMCLIRPTIDLEHHTLELNHPKMAKIKFSTNITVQEEKFTEAAMCQSKVCGDHIDGVDCGDEIAQWLSKALGVLNVRLIRQCEHKERKQKNPKKSGNEDDVVSAANMSLANQAQFLLINTASIDWLIGKVQESRDTDELQPADSDLEQAGMVDRFRGNLVLETTEALVEMQWKVIRIGKIKLLVTAPCTRCQMICIDQSTGEKTVEPLRTVARELKGKINFGIYLSRDIVDNSESDFLDCNEIVSIE